MSELKHVNLTQVTDNFMHNVREAWKLQTKNTNVNEGIVKVAYQNSLTNVYNEINNLQSQLKTSQDELVKLTKANSILREALEECDEFICNITGNGETDFRNKIKQALNKEGSVSGNASLEEV